MVVRQVKDDLAHPRLFQEMDFMVDKLMEVRCAALNCAALYCTALCCTALCCTALCCTALCCTVLYCTVLHCAALYCTVLHCTAQYSAALCCTVLYSAALYSAALYCAALYCAALYCAALHCAGSLARLHLAVLALTTHYLLQAWMGMHKLATTPMPFPFLQVLCVSIVDHIDAISFPADAVCDVVDDDDAVDAAVPFLQMLTVLMYLWLYTVRISTSQIVFIHNSIYSLSLGRIIHLLTKWQRIPILNILLNNATVITALSTSLTAVHLTALCPPP